VCSDAGVQPGATREVGGLQNKNMHFPTPVLGKRYDDSVDTATELRPSRPRNQGSTLGRASSPPPPSLLTVHTTSGALSDSYGMGFGGCFPKCKGAETCSWSLSPTISGS
jgi:hypothetical protein